MRVALIAPPYPLEENPSPPVGIGYIAAVLEEAGADVVFLDYIVRQYTEEKLVEELTAFKPDVVGINSVTMNFKTAAGILRTAKRHDPNLVTMMGGPHVTFEAESTLEQYPEIDVIVTGEGEQTVRELLPLIKDRAEWGSVKGIAFSYNGGVVRTEQRELIGDLDALPLPSRHLMPMSRYRALGYPVNIITSRGCPGRCIFCVGRRMVGRKLRNRNPSLVVDEMEQVLSYGFERINIADDCFTTNKRRVRALCDEIIGRKLEFGWSAFVRADTLSVECLQIMKDAGCDTVSFGVESGNPEMLKRIRKGITLDNVRRAVDYCDQVGMTIFASFMVGLPGESRETLLDSQRFAEELQIDFGYHFLSPFPGTVIKEEQDRFDISILTQDWDRYDANKAITSTSHLSPEEVESFVHENYTVVGEQDFKEAEERFYSGRATVKDYFRIEGKRTMEFIFRLLSEDMIEEHARFSADKPEPEDQLFELSASISGLTGLDFMFVDAVLKRLFGSGLLKYRRDGDEMRWYWTHNKDIDIYPLER